MSCSIPNYSHKWHEKPAPPQAVTGFKPEHSQTQEEKDQEQHWHAVDDLRP